MNLSIFSNILTLMGRGKAHMIFCLLIFLSVVSCTKEGDTIYMLDPNDPKPDHSPLITVIYDVDGIGDQSYNDLIYQGVEDAAIKNGARTMQLQPKSLAEGELMLNSAFDRLSDATDTVRRLLIVTSSAYDSIVRANNKRLEQNPNADLLYLDTSKPLDGKGSTLYINYFGAMYEAGYFAPVFCKNVLLVAANPHNEAVNTAAEAFVIGFKDSKI